MANRPNSRKKRVGTGSVKVKRRGSGLASSGIKAVARSSRSSRSSSSSRPSSIKPTSFNASNASSVGRSSLMSKLILIVLVIVAIFFIYNFLTGGGLANTGLSSEEFINDSVTTDNVSSTDSYANLDAYNVDRSVSENARAKKTLLQGNGNDIATVMIYILGTDLESKSGMATGDIMEMAQATISDKVNIIIQTGGTKKWKNDIISSKTNQRYQVTSEGLLLLEEDLGKKSMVDPNTLSDFIQYTKNNYPADRYQLILWDHGGGSLTGFGYDEYFPNDHMTLDEVQTALRDGGTEFDFIGFDACLMGSLETAMVLAPFADYMIASEETEPGIGWYYTDWLTSLSMNTSIPTIDLGKQIIDDYIYYVAKKTPRSQGTLAMIDLAELEASLPRSLQNFASSTLDLIEKSEYKVISDARAGTKEFSKAHKLNQIDLIDFASKINTNESLDLVEILQGSIKYNRTTRNITNANGLSIYFPYNDLAKLDSMINTYEEIGMNDEYTDVVKSFASVAAGGQVVSSASGNMLESLLGGASSEQVSNNSSLVGGLLESFISNGDFSSIAGGVVGAATNWFKPELALQSSEYYEENLLNTEELVLSGKNGQRILKLSEKQWELIQALELNVFIDDGEGYIDLGLDNVFEFNDDGDLIMEYDETWLSINGHIVSYYMVTDESTDDNYYIKGRVPAFLNDQLVDIIIIFDDVNPYGTIIGAQINYDETGESEAIAKGLIEILVGDKIDFICDYYTYSGKYIDSYLLGEELIATSKWTIENLSISEYDYKMTYKITDIYNNHYWTPSVSN